MSIRIFGKKALAIFMSMTMLVSCMVFSFSASAESKLLWENNFDEQLATNWYSLYGSEDGLGNYNTGRVDNTSDNIYNYFVPKKDAAGNGYMAYGVASDTGHQRPAGFIITHQSATVKNAAVDTYGNSGYHMTTTSVNKGAFKPKAGKYAVKLDYKVPATANLTSDVELYIAFSDKLWKSVCNWGSGGTSVATMEANGKLIKEKIATATQQDAGGDWQTAVAYVDASAIPTNLTSDTGWWASIIARPVNTSAASMSGSEVWIDNVSISLYNDMSDFPTISFYYNGINAGETSGAAGTPFTMPDLSSITVPAGGKFAYYSDEACTQAIALPTVFPAASQNIYIKVLDPVVRPATLMWENGFDEQTSSNWFSKYGDKSDKSIFNTGVVGQDANDRDVYFVPQKDAAGNGYMAYGAGSETGSMYGAGFIVMHHEATSKKAADAGQYGHAGNYTYDSNLQGAFQPSAGKYAVKLDYRVPETAQLATDIELYVAFSDRTWGSAFNWSSGGSNIVKDETNGTLIKQLIATAKPSDAGANWQTAVVYMDMPEGKNWWVSVIARPATSSKNTNYAVSEVWVDNIEVHQYDDLSEFPGVTFYYDGNAVDCVNGLAGAAFTAPDLSSITVPAGGKLAYYSDEACTVPVTLPTVFPAASQNIYVKVIEPTVHASTLKWENNFNEQTASNWYSLYGGPSDWSAFNTGVVNVDASNVYNYFVPQKDAAGNGYMAYGYTNEMGSVYPAGFIMLHQDATSKSAADAGQYGHAGKYTGTNNAYGAFQPESGKYAIKLDYKVPDTASLTTEVELYIAFSSKLWATNNMSTTTATPWGDYSGGITRLEKNGQLIKQKIATVYPSDAGGEWQTAVAYMDVTVPDDKEWFVSIIARPAESKKNYDCDGSEVWVDNIEVHQYNDLSELSSVTFHYDGGVVGQLHSLSGVPFEMPTLSIHTPIGAYLSYYADEACTQPIELPTVYPTAAQDIYIKLTKTENFTWSFEDEAVDTLLSLNNNARRTITVDDAMANEGVHSARVNGNTKTVQHYPQMTLRDGNSQKIQVYKNRSYEVSFKIFKPTTEPTYKMNYWLAVTEDELPISRMDDGKVANEVVRRLAVQTQTGQWVDMTTTITDCAFTGLLRLGISGDYEGAHTFYIDDITVTEITPDPDNSVDSFERYDESKTVLSFNTDGSSITVSDIDHRSGSNCAKIMTLGNSINAAPQMTVNDFRTNSITVEKGKNYRVSFYVLNPIQQPDYDIRFWLAATDSNAAFTATRENVILDTQTIAIEEKSVWQRVSVNIINCAYSGKLRLGITGSTDEAHIFYIDDIGVSEYKEANPNAMNFEMYEVGETIELNRNKNNTITITDKMSYTGDKSAYFSSDTNTYDNRPHMFVRDAEGNIVKVKKGDDFVVSFMIYISSSQPYFSFAYWLAATPEADGDKPFEYSADRSKYTSRNFLLPGEVKGGEMPPAGEWTMVKIAVMDCPYEGNLRIGMSHFNRDPYYSNFYIDDITINPPEYVLVKFNTNGAENTYEDVTILADMLLPTDDYIPPYREGYQFMGWYTSPNFEKDTYFDIYSTPVTAKENGVLTLYAMWREWSEDKSTVSGREETEKYKTEYYTDKVWVGDQNVPDPWDTGDVPSYTEEEAVTVPPATDADESPNDGIPPWLIVVIIIAAVVIVGGGAVIAAIMLKKNKKA